MSVDTDKDVQSLLEAIIRESGRQADLVDQYLVVIGFLPPRDRRNGRTWSLPADLLHKLAALLKLYQWERAGITPHLRTPLPAWQEVYADVVAQATGQTPQFSGAALSQQVLQAFLEQIAWTPLENQEAEVAVVQRGSADAFLDELARVLWKFRHLTPESDDSDDRTSQR